MKILFAVASYLLGAIPTGYLIFRLSEKKDIRSFGSGSTGATNIMRTKGLFHAIPVLVVDVGKGVAAAWLAARLFNDPLFTFTCGFLAVLGHCYPVYLGFKGGKGVATSLGVFAYLGFTPFLLSLFIFFLVAGLSRYVSLASLLSVLSYPFLALVLTGNSWLALTGSSIFILVALRHTGNIKRLISRTERKLGKKKS